MNVEILIVTHARDMAFLRYCLASIEKFAHGFSGVTVLVPEHEKDLFFWIPPSVRLKHFPEPGGKGMLAHEIQICRADEWCLNADMILHLDADTMFWRPATPDGFMHDGKPVLVRERYADCWKSTTGRLLWQKAVERSCGFRPEWETMVRQGALHLRELYPATRAIVERHTGRLFDEYMLDGPNSFPQAVAEFPMLGAVAIRDFAMRYHFVDYDHDRDARECHTGRQVFQYLYRKERDHLVEFWGHGGIERYRKTADRILNSNIPDYILK
jgi:hypothetical protein